MMGELDGRWAAIIAALSIVLPAAAVAAGWGQSARRRHALAVAALAGLTVLPVVSAVRLPLFAVHYPAPVESNNHSAFPAPPLTPLPIETHANPPGVTEPNPIPGPTAVMPPEKRSNPTVAALVSLWLGGVAVGALRIGIGWRRARRCHALATPIPDSKVLEIAIIAARIVRLRRPPALLQSATVSAPRTLGLIRPAVVLPVDLVHRADHDAVRQVLLHEFAHVRRGDAWIGLWQRVIGAIYWFSPPVWALQRRLGLAREELCDEQVIRSEPRTAYARTLLDLAQRQAASPCIAAGLAATGSALEIRIERILSANPPTRWGRCRFTLSALGIALVPVAPMLVELTPALAAGTHAAADPPEAQKPFATSKDQTRVVIDADGRVLPMVVLPIGGEAKATGREATVLPGVKIRAEREASVDVAIATGNPYSFLPASVVAEIGAAITGEVDLAKADPTALAMAGLTNVLFTRQTVFKVARLRWYDLGVGPPGGEVDVLVTDQSKPRIAILGRNWLRAAARGENGLVIPAVGPVVFGRMVPGANGEMLVQPASGESVRSPLFHGAEMHVAGVYGSGQPDGQTIDVVVKPTEKPLVLVLTAYEQTIWNLKLEPGAELKHLILAGYFQQSVTGLPPYATVQYHTYFPRGLSPPEPGYFYAYDRTKPDYPKLVAALDKLVGLPVRSFQGQERAQQFSVGGLANSPERAALADCELQVVGIYSGKLRAPRGPQTVAVDVKPTAKPMVLALMAYSATKWQVHLAPGARVQAVILAGYYNQEIEGLPATVPVTRRTYFDAAGKPQRNGPPYFYAYKERTPEYLNAVAELKRLTGLDVRKFRGDYDPDRVVIE